MSNWSKVKGWPPLGWWYHKILCEIGWALRNNNIFGHMTGWSIYYRHLNIMCTKYRINLYGEPIVQK